MLPSPEAERGGRGAVYEYVLQRRSIGGTMCSQRKRSTGVGDTLLRRFIRQGRRLRRQLQHGRLLSLGEKGQEDDLSVRKFQRIMVRLRVVLCRLAGRWLSYDQSFSSSNDGKAECRNGDMAGKRNLRTRQDTNRCLESSWAENPRVPVPKLRVVILSPTLAGRDCTACRLKSHISRKLLQEASQPAHIKRKSQAPPLSGSACAAPKYCT